MADADFTATEGIASTGPVYDLLGPEESAVEALTEYLRSVPGVARTIRGFPEREEDLDLAAGPNLSVFAPFEGRREICSPGLISSGGPPFLWRYGHLRMTVQVDIWCGYRHVRDVMSRVVLAALNNQMPFRQGLTIKSRHYYDRPIHIEERSADYVGDMDAPDRGEWRKMFQLELVTDLVHSTDTPAFSEGVIRDGNNVYPDKLIR